MNNTWDTLYEAAKEVLNPRKISEWMEAGGVAAAIETAGLRKERSRYVRGTDAEVVDIKWQNF